MKAGEQPAAETLLTAFKTIDAKERRRHASVLNYWLSIRGDKEFPPLHDLDPLELSDAGPNSALLELLSGGHDAEIRHLGEVLRDGDDWPERIMDADNPSILACIAKKLPIVAISRDFLAFEDQFEGPDGKTRCWATLLPLSAGGAWVDYVYALVSFETEGAKKAPAKKARAPEPEAEEIDEPVAEVIEEPVAEQVGEPVAEDADEPIAGPEEPVAEEVEEPFDRRAVETEEPEAVADEAPLAEAEERDEPVQSAVAKAAPGFSKLLDSIAGLTGFYGSQPVKVDPVIESEAEPAEEGAACEPIADEPIAEEAVAEEPVTDEPAANKPVAEEPAAEPAQSEQPVPKAAEKPTRASEGSLQNKLTDVRTKTNEARLAQLRAQAALYEGLSAAYDFAVDAEEAPEEYLRLVEAQGLKIQLRAPMKPVVKLAFEGMCDEATIKQLEAVLSWALKEELPRGSLLEHIEAAGGVGEILNGKKAA
jgi:outer membrane biosynthesis protein TonB